MSRIQSSTKPRRVVVFAYDGVQTLDVTGPIEVFAIASRLLHASGAKAPGYSTEIVAARAGVFRSSSGIAIQADSSIGALRGHIDTFMVAGGTGCEAAATDERTVASIRRRAMAARRAASVCTGALLFARAGILDGRRVTTHWRFCEELAARFPALRVEADAIYVRDGRLWSSAGVTAGMDLALALVEEDHGRDLALSVARWLVMFLKRPGGQSQFSAQLSAQAAEREPLRDLQAWIAEHPGADLNVETLAARTAMSPRNFARVFARETGLTPARYVERVRVEAARRQLEEGSESVEGVAAACGFGSAETMRRAFLRTLRVGPAEYRQRFRTRAA